MNRDLRGKALIKYKESLRLNDEQRDIIVGTLLGDATFEGLRDGKPFYGLAFTQSERHECYLNHLFQKFEPFCGTGPKKRLVVTNKTHDNITYRFRTYRHIALKHYHDLFYSLDNGKLVKRIPDTIHKYLTPRALAYWFLDDGTKSKETYQFCTDCFTHDDQVLLQKALFANFGLTFNVTKYHQKYYRLYLVQTSRDQFLEIISPYVMIDELRCMHYKI